MSVTEIKIIRYAKKNKKQRKTKWDDERLQLQWRDFPTMTWQWICAEKVIRVSQKDNHSAVIKKNKIKNRQDPETSIYSLPPPFNECKRQRDDGNSS